MEFGRPGSSQTYLSVLDLPPHEKRSLDFLARGQALGAGEVQIYVGCPIWGKKEWVGKVYPPGTPPQDFLWHYSRQFRAIELNTTFYRIPDLKSVQAWKVAVPEDFKFCPKFFQGISHSGDLRGIRPLVQSFVDACLGFGNALGISFLQLPPDFGWTRWRELQTLLSWIPRGFPLSVEFRHPSWFVKQSLRSEAYELLCSRQAAGVITDTLGRRDVLHVSLTARTAFIRFLGNGEDPSNERRIEDWVERILAWKDLGMEQIYFFVHQPDDILAPELVGRMIDRLNKKGSLQLRKWTPCEAEGQLNLFG